MQYHFAPRMQTIKPSVIREMIKYSSQPGVIPFSAGNPSSKAFPLDEIREITANILNNSPVNALQYGIAEGLLELRQIIKTALIEEFNNDLSQDDVMIMTGAQQTIDLTSKAFCSSGDSILCESPSFTGALNAFKANDAKLIGIEVEHDGINLTQLEQTLKKNPTVRMLYTIPNFQNPTGITMSLNKRKALYQLAKQYGIILLEDNPYGKLRFHGTNLPSIKSFDTDGIVVYCGSFSKVLAPGLRVGFVCAPKEIIQKLTVLKQANDVHTSMLSQMITCQFLKNYNFKQHIENLCSLYRGKAKLMLTQMQTSFPKELTWTRPEGGLFVWCTLPKSICMHEFCENALQNFKVAVVPGNAFLINPTDSCQSVRLTFATPSNEQIVSGINRLGGMLKKLL